MSWKTDRKEPYIEETISRQPCIRCAAPSLFQWSICADGNRYRPLCLDCDVGLNRLVLTWMRHPEAEQLGDRYEQNKRREAAQ